MITDFQNSLNYYLSLEGVDLKRKEQAEDLFRRLDLSSLPYISIIETGASQNLQDACFGLLFGHLALTSNSIMYSVDISPEVVEASKEMYSSYLPHLQISHHVEDSLNFLQNFQGSPTIVHLDSWDLDIWNPEPAMLHGYLEFVSIKDKMPSGSYIIVDDNFFRGTTIWWNIYENGNLTDVKEFLVNQEILGKGSMIYHYVKTHDCGWELVGDPYLPFGNRKIVLRKK